MSDWLEVAVADYPSAPAPVTKDNRLSSLHSIAVMWDEVAFTQIGILGYELWMDDSNGLFTLVQGGRNMPGLMSYTAATIPGRAYSFKVRAINFNGVGPFSSPALFYSCLPPT